MMTQNANKKRNDRTNLWNSKRKPRTQMFDNARADGVHPLIVPAYRANEQQREMFQDKINSYINEGCSESWATEKATGWAAKPGYSEHETSLAVDINAESGNGIQFIIGWLQIVTSMGLLYDTLQIKAILQILTLNRGTFVMLERKLLNTNKGN